MDSYGSSSSLSINNNSSYGLSYLVDNPYALGIMTILVFAYASYARTSRTPDILTNLFRNDIFRVVFLSLILMLKFNKSPTMSILVAVFFVVVIGKIMAEESWEYFSMVNAARRKRRPMRQ